MTLSIGLLDEVKSAIFCEMCFGVDLWYVSIGSFCNQQNKMQRYDLVFLVFYSKLYP